MFEANTDLRLFGYDLRSAGSFLRTGVVQLLWDNDSPIRQKLDEPVRATVLSPQSKAVLPPLWFRGSQQLVGDVHSESACSAIVLPDDLVLHRTLTLPGALSSSIREAVQMDVKAFSPFPEDDTAFGWRVTASDAQQIAVDVAIVSRAAAAHVVRELEHWDQEGGTATQAIVHNTGGPEVWSFTPGTQHPVVINGFGEGDRNGRYRNQLRKVFAAASIFVVALAFAPLFSGILLSLRAESLDAQVSELRASTADELSMREELSVLRQLGDRLATEVGNQADFASELSVLTAQIPDSAFANRVELQGRQLRVAGLAGDAASLMALLSEYPGYEQVVNKGGFRRDRSGKELYNFEIALAGSRSGVAQ